jgi:hypothetical protein
LLREIAAARPLRKLDELREREELRRPTVPRQLEPSPSAP